MLLFSIIVIISMLFLLCTFCVDNNPHTLLGRLKLNFLDRIKRLFNLLPDFIRIRTEKFVNYVVWQKNPIVQVITISYNHRLYI